MKANKFQGIHLLRAAAAQGVNGAQYQLGLVLLEGRQGQKVDASEAMVWFKKAAQSADMDIAMDAGEKIWQMYYHGKGVKQNFRAARLWLKKVLAHAEDENALAAMIEIYQKGLGVKANPKQAAILEKRLLAF